LLPEESAEFCPINGAQVAAPGSTVTDGVWLRRITAFCPKVMGAAKVMGAVGRFKDSFVTVDGRVPGNVAEFHEHRRDLPKLRVPPRGRVLPDLTLDWFVLPVATGRVLALGS
jgi:hypothetical protein